MALQRSAVLFAVALTLGAVTVTAEAQPPAPARDPAAAEVLFRDAVAARDKGDWRVACTKFNASMGLDPAASTLINIAKCHEHEGKLASAWAAFNQALVLNGETTGAKRTADLEKYAKSLIAAIEPRLPRLKIVLRERPAGLRITRDGVEVPAAVLGEALPVDPGAHEIEGSAPGYQSEKRTVKVTEGKTATVELMLVAEAPGSGGGPSRRRVGAFVAGGIGIAGGVIGAVAGGLMLAKIRVASANCTDAANGVSLCRNAEGLDAGNSAKTLGLVSSVGWVTALAGLGVGTVLWVTEPGSAKPAKGGQSGRWVRVGLLEASASGSAFGVGGGW